jgi:opacity protein-like surface antigen
MSPGRGLGLTCSLLAVAALARPAVAQTIVDQQDRLIDLHSLLLDLPPLQAPGSYRPWEVGLGLELIGIPTIDGSTGSKRQITASDRTSVFPRPRAALGLPAPDGWRAFAGAAYIPPISLNEVSSHYGALEAGLAWVPGPATVGLRGRVIYAESKSPVTDPATRDTLRTFEYGADLSAARTFAVPFGTATPYAGVGVTVLDGKFTVTSDGVELRSQYTALALHAGLRFLLRERWEGVAEVDGYPGRLLHPSFRLGYRFDLARR